MSGAHTDWKEPSQSADDEDIVPPFPDRKHPAHHPPIERHNKPIVIFLTVCTHQRQKILTAPQVHAALLDAWNSSNHWMVGRYVIMPDHIHLFCSLATQDAVGVAQWVTYWKRMTSQQLPKLQLMWQRDCWDTQLRHHESYSEKWESIRNNPVRAGLVAKADEWLYQGSVNHLPW